jgi:hypothetical protein
MATIIILNQLIDDLAVAFPELVAKRDLYLVPTITFVPIVQSFELQVAESAIEYGDFDGGIRTQQFTIDIGVLIKSTVDWQDKHAEILSDTEKSLHVIKERVITALEGSFLTTSDLTRPLRIYRESAVVAFKANGVDGLVKILTFIGGLNDIRPR